MYSLLLNQSKAPDLIANDEKEDKTSKLAQDQEALKEKVKGEKFNLYEKTRNTMKKMFSK
jgi:phage/plasmid primase-like uncharacterized protein